jgi:hypothetical protein
MHHQWKIRRHLIEAPDALQRWDRAYQSLLRWSIPPVPKPAEENSAVVQHKEGYDEPCDVCSGIHTSSSTDADD